MVPIIADESTRFAAMFSVSLVSVAAADGLVGSTPTSGASINPLTSSVNVSLMDRNYPYGLLQFSTNASLIADSSIIPVATEKPQVAHLCSGNRINPMYYGRKIMLYRFSVYIKSTSEQFSKILSRRQMLRCYLRACITAVTVTVGFIYLLADAAVYNSNSNGRDNVNYGAVTQFI